MCVFASFRSLSIQLCGFSVRYLMTLFQSRDYIASDGKVLSRQLPGGTERHQENPARTADIPSEIQTEHLPHTERYICSVPLTFYCFLLSCLHYVISFYYIPLFLLSSLFPFYTHPFLLSTLNSHGSAREIGNLIFLFFRPHLELLLISRHPVQSPWWRCELLFWRREIYNSGNYSTFHIVRNNDTKTNQNTFTERNQKSLFSKFQWLFANYVRCKRAYSVYIH